MKLSLTLLGVLRFFVAQLYCSIVLCYIMLYALKKKSYFSNFQTFFFQRSLNYSLSDINHLV